MLIEKQPLTEDELLVIAHRFGIGESNGQEPLGFSQEKADSLETSALRKLRHLTMEDLSRLRQAV